MRIENCRSISARLPQYQFEIRRRCADDEYFCSVCADYEAATAALGRWLADGENAMPKVAEFRQMLIELEAEILSLLKHQDRELRSGRGR
jgi:hypothetical protein